MFRRRAVWPLVAVLLVGCRVGEVERGPGAGAPAAPADNAAAASMLADARAALERGAAERAGQIAEQIMRRYPRTSSALPAHWIAARAAMARGDYANAITYAEAYADRTSGQESERARALARKAQEARRRAAEAVTVGVVLPRSDAPYLERYGELVMEGIRLALEEAGSAGALNLITLDDRGDPERDPALVDELMARGARIVIGPMLTAGVRAAVAARGGATPALISPTASERLTGLPNAYTLNAGDALGAEALARYARSAGLRRAAVMYPRWTDFEDEARAFMRDFESAGGMMAAVIPYDSGTTTFRPHLERLAETRPDVVFLPVPAGDVRQLAPQLSYYGVDTTNSVLMGGKAWAEEELRRVIEPRFLNGVIVATPLPGRLVDPAWDEFVLRYEQRYRRSLDNPFPALGYDAARLALSALVPGQNSPEQVAERLARTEDLRGATGVISVRDGEVTRRPYLVRIQDGRLEPASPPERLRTLPGGVQHGGSGSDGGVN